MLAAAIILTSLIVAPLTAFANGNDHSIDFTVIAGNAGEITNINIRITGATDPEFFMLWVFKFDGTFEELFALDEAAVLQYLVYGQFEEGPDPGAEGFFWVDSDPWHKNVQLVLSEGRYLAVGLSSSIFDDAIRPEHEPGPYDFLIREFYVGTGHVAASQWVRNVQMTCYQVWVNEDNNFEFVFWWEYKNNNWVKIYDMAGAEVFAIDMKYGNAKFEVDLPDGMYTVKTFHLSDTPIQEFIIGKP